MPPLPAALPEPLPESGNKLVQLTQNVGAAQVLGVLRVAGPGRDASGAPHVFLKSFYRSQLSHKSVNLSFTMTNIKNKLTNLGGN